MSESNITTLSDGQPAGPAPARPAAADVGEVLALEGVSSPLRALGRLIEQNPFLAIAGVVALFLGSMAMGGCEALEPTTPSPITGENVTHRELQAQLTAELRTRDQAIVAHQDAARREIEAAQRLDADTDGLVAEFEDANEDLNAKREARGAVAAQVGELASQVPYGSTIWGVLTGGLMLDWGRKELKIRRQRKQLAGA